jgi:DNA-binding transcriptional regulator YdaS (Cro superfamily)
MQLGEWLEQGRMSGGELAKRIGTTRQAVHSWIDGRTRPKVYYALAVETVTGGEVPVSSWLTNVESLALKGMQVAPGGPGRE